MTLTFYRALYSTAAIAYQTEPSPENAKRPTESETHLPSAECTTTIN